MLPGGHNSQVYFANSGGEMVGLSETGQADSCASPFQQFRFQAVKWAPNGRATRLDPLRDDTVSFALAMNESGQAVGASGQCSNVFPPLFGPHAPHAVFWDSDGSATDLGTPKDGIGDNVAAGINNWGDVVMNAVMTGGTSSSLPPFRAFVWNRSTRVLKPLHTLSADAVQTVTPCCNVINDSGQIVGFSVDTAGPPQAILWQNADAMPVTLDSLVQDSDWTVLIATGINRFGEIAGWASYRGGDAHAVVLSPRSRKCSGDASRSQDCDN
jgi:probable HAF family extracellular repeat protein